MSREIKFRAWDKADKKWLFGYEYANLGGFSLIGEVTLMGELNSVRLERWNDVEIMQYSGLKDKNGVEVYEGDIVRYQHNIYEVRWRNGCFEMYGKSPSDPYHAVRDCKHSTTKLSEVIGNIYENPELITK
jgi:uncharacterized phage protein (TIGR01671 family)